jgi:hypothetical protein
VLRQAAGHDGVGGDLLDAGLAAQRFHLAQDVRRRARDARTHRLHPRERGRHDGQPVRPATRLEQRVHLIGGVGAADDLDALARELTGARRARQEAGLLGAPAQRVVDPVSRRALARRQDDPERLHLGGPGACGHARAGMRMGLVTG